MSLMIIVLLFLSTLFFDMALEYDSADDSKPNWPFHKIIRKVNQWISDDDAKPIKHG